MRSTTALTFLSLVACGILSTSPALAQKSGKKPDKGAETKTTEDSAKKADDTTDKSADDAKKDKSAGDAKKDDAKTDGSGGEAAKSSTAWDIYDVEELPGKSYFFVGARYRGNIIPQFMLNAFLDEGKTIYTNMVGVEFDLRKDGFSLIPALSFHELGTGDVLFKQKNKADKPQNWGIVNSEMKVVYASIDVLWSTKISKNVEFEYGAGFGIGAVFGDLQNSWVRQDNVNGTFSASNGNRYSRCETVLQPGTGCNRLDHQDSDVDKVGGYKEKSWFEGGSKPALFPWLSVPQLGLRVKPIKNFVARVGVGFALTGFWFGLDAMYGLEKKPVD